MSSIEDLKALISKKGGLARANRFRVIFTPPAQTLFNLDGQQIISSVISGNFTAKNLINDPRDINLLCDAVSIPGKQISTLDYQAEKQSIKIPYGVINEDVTMSFILTNDYYMKKLFDSWQSGVFDVERYRAGYKKDFTTDIVIQQLNSKNIPVYGVRLENAFPITVSAVSLDNNSENSVQKMSVTLSYDNYVPEDIVDTIKSTAGVIGATIGI